VERDGKFYKKFYGMSSHTAMLKHTGAVAEYRSSEGRSVEVPFRGPINPCCLDLLGGLRSTCTYVGAASLKELSKVGLHEQFVCWCCSCPCLPAIVAAFLYSVQRSSVCLSS
jgi:IMP dehydrogenase/GMP reductase